MGGLLLLTGVGIGYTAVISAMEMAAHTESLVSLYNPVDIVGGMGINFPEHVDVDHLPADVHKAATASPLQNSVAAAASPEYALPGLIMPVCVIILAVSERQRALDGSRISRA